jgi:tetratricopeptide (TPR) repeat protein
LQILKVLFPFVALTFVYMIVRTLALKGFAHPAAKISWLAVVLTWPSLLLFYLKLLFWPAGLSPFYGLQFVTHPTLRNTILPALVLFFVAGGLWWWAGRVRAVALAIPWLVLPLLPVLNIQIFGNGNFAHNRYLYLPSVGFAVLVALALRQVKLGRLVLGAFPLSQALVIVGLASLGCCSVQLEDRYYASDATFYAFAYSRMGGPDPVIGMDYANTLAEQGDYIRAAAIYRELIQAHPDMWTAYFNLGYMYYQRGELDSAVQYFSRAAAGDPAQAGAIFYLGLTDLKLHHMDEAEANLRRAIDLAPSFPNYHFALGVVLRVKGNLSGALAEFSQELALDAGHQAAAQQVAEIRKQMANR